VVDAAEAIVNQTPGFDNKHGVAVNRRVIGNQVPVEVRELDWEHLVQMVEHHWNVVTPRPAPPSDGIKRKAVKGR
jgi:hypothetical protein